VQLVETTVLEIELEEEGPPELAAHMRTDLVLDALEMGNGLRRPATRRPGEGLIAHSDRDEELNYKTDNTRSVANR
jgi:hypothetical protein